ncbi:MAG: iron ABC transporter permease, partial [Oscillospiraceae bacterium]|nr:iron ABC transporter permease [Oscillospiraceae bacterium]
AGAGLAVAGALIQGVLANSLASPGIIGVNAGAGLGVTLCCALGAISGWAVAGSAFVGALAAVLTVAVAARKTAASRSAVILGGVAVNSFLAAISEAITTLFSDVSSLSADFRTGGFSGVSPARLVPAGIAIIAALAVSLSLSNELDLLAMGEDTAQGLGLPVKKVRTLFLVLAAMLAGASVSFAGLLGFVGLIVPNMARRIVGGESKRILPICAVGGAAFVTLCDCIARVMFAPFEIPAGIVMSAVGAPFFIFLLFRRKGGHSRG